jgi:hypothetical protein
MTKDTELDVSTDDGRRIIIQPKPTSRKERLASAHRRMVKHHDATFRKLAN